MRHPANKEPDLTGSNLMGGKCEFAAVQRGFSETVKADLQFAQIMHQSLGSRNGRGKDTARIAPIA